MEKLDFLIDYLLKENKVNKMIEQTISVNEDIDKVVTEILK